jgi:NAD(P)-dependent dehydrogenase (short-subunit alcohol dehydrogenase family)
MAGGVVLITGTSTGIGLEAAVGAARAGWRTVATMRDPGRGDALRKAAEAAGVDLDVRALDVTDDESVSSAIEGVAAEYGRLDALVNNAGAGHVGTVELGALDDVRRVMEVNFFGVVRATKAAMPHLRASTGRLITVTSVGGVVGQPFNEAYCAAKFAVEGFMESLAPVAASVGVQVTMIEPGAVATEFVANIGVDVPAVLAAAGPYEPAIREYIARTQQRFATAAQTAEQAAAPIVQALTQERPPLRVQTSDAARALVGLKLADLDGSVTVGETATWLR